MFKTLPLIALASLAAGAAHAQPAYPDRPITIVVPYGPGGTNDILARAIAAKISTPLGQTVVVVNRAGAGGNIGAAEVAAAQPDGYTLLLASSGVFAVNKWLYSKLAYDPATAFAPVVLVGEVPNVLLATPSLPVHNLAELVAYSKANPDKLNFASMGTGTSGHLCAELLKMQAGIQGQHVPYKGSAAALTDMVGGQVQVMCDNLPTARPQAQSGKLRALAVTSARRTPLLPDVPTIAESGYPTFDATAWFGIAAPKGTPGPVVQRLNREINKAMNDPQLREVMAAQGVNYKENTPEAFAAYIDAESAKWKQVVETSGMRAD